MNIHLFFEGKMGCEEMASAFLATLLDQEPTFRGKFFALFKGAIADQRIDALSAKQWTIKVEEDNIDIYLEASDDSAIILIENKILAGSVQKGQLYKYYAHQARHDKKKAKQIAAVYLAPGTGTGAGEVDEVRYSDLMKDRPGDFALRVSWNQVFEAASDVAESSPNAEFIRSGCDQIERLIEAGPVQKWPRAGERQIIYDIVNEARAQLSQAFPDVQIGTPWPSCACYTLSTHKTKLTMWLSAYFNVDKDPPHRPIGLVNGDQLSFEICAQLRLAIASRRVPELKTRWTSETAGQSLEIPGWPAMPIDPNGWATSRNHTTGTRQQVVNELVSTGSKLLQHVLTYQCQ